MEGSCYMDMMRLQSQRREILEIAARHGASNVRIFGSVVRGESRSESDVDVLVDLAPDRSLIDHIGLIQDLEDLLGCKVDVISAKGLREPIRRHVLNEAISL
jgi:uncharacterized protein